MQYTERMKLALNYAEESSKRARWIIFMLQLAVVLVVASIWQQTDTNWTFSRLRAGQNLENLLICDPSSVYGADAVKHVNESLPSIKDATATPFTTEYLDSRYRCEVGLSPDEKKQALDYESGPYGWHFSLPEAKKNVADLQQVVASRALGVYVPILGITFDVNDLDVLAGFTFVILLSWLHFALRRQKKNVHHVFNLAREAEDPEEKDRVKRLAITYNLLAMTQVLTVPPASRAELRVAAFKRFIQPSNLILWTAVLAQLIMVIDDVQTSFGGEVLNKAVTWVETGLAAVLFIYVVIRTFLCSKTMRDTDAVWDAAFLESHPQPPEPPTAASTQQAGA